MNPPNGDGLACDAPAAPNIDTGAWSAFASLRPSDFSVIGAEDCKDGTESPNIGAGGGETVGLEKMLELAKKFGMDEPPAVGAGSFDSVVLACPVPKMDVFGDGGVKSIVGSTLLIGVEGAGAEILGAPPAVPTGGVFGAPCAASPPDSARGSMNAEGLWCSSGVDGFTGLLKENGSAEIGGSFASLSSCLTGVT